MFLRRTLNRENGYIDWHLQKQWWKYFEWNAVLEPLFIVFYNLEDEKCRNHRILFSFKYNIT